MKTQNKIGLSAVKYTLALIIVVMGGYGYYQFFSNGEVSIAVIMIIGLFIMIEITMLSMTTINFEDTISQDKHLSIGLLFAIIVMWMISTVGIDQTIWHTVESKYHAVQVQQSAVDAEQKTEQALLSKINDYNIMLSQHQKELTSEKIAMVVAKKDFDKKSRQLKDTIWFDGKRCDLSVDCSARKNNASYALDISKQLLDTYLQNLKILKKKITVVEENIQLARGKIDTIVMNREKFFKEYNTQKKNKQEEGIIHTRIMDLLNLLLDDEIKTPERAYVMLLSAVVYPIYILFVMFVSAQTPQKRDVREKQQMARERVSLENMRNKTRAYDGLVIVANQFKKIVMYLIKTRKRKIIEKIVEIEVEKEIEVIKEIYKDGKEIVEVKVEVPYIIEKEVIVERIVEKPIIEKEFVVIPADIDLNKLNEITGNGSTPRDLSDILKEISDNPSKFTFGQGAYNDKYRAA